MGDKKKYVPSFGLAGRGCVRRKAKRASDEPPGVEDVATLVSHPVAVVLVREDDLYPAPIGRFMKALENEKTPGGVKWCNTHACG